MSLFPYIVLYLIVLETLTCAHRKCVTSFDAHQKKYFVKMGNQWSNFVTFLTSVLLCIVAKV